MNFIDMALLSEQTSRWSRPFAAPTFRLNTISQVSGA
jgi:hypothetical protein